MQERMQEPIAEQEFGGILFWGMLQGLWEAGKVLWPHIWPYLLILFALIVLKTLLKSRSISDRLHRGRVLGARRIEDVLRNSPEDFERLCRYLLAAKGFKVKRRGGSGDGGVDLLAVRPGERAVVQCKRYSARPVGVSVARELLGSVVAEKADHGYLVTTSTFTKDAREFARRQPITLVDGVALVRDIKRTLPGGLPDEPDGDAPPVAEDAVAADQPARAQIVLAGDEPLEAGYPITCSSCGKLDTVPFRPRGDKPLFCRACYANRRGKA